LQINKKIINKIRLDSRDFALKMEDLSAKLVAALKKTEVTTNPQCSERKNIPAQGKTLGKFASSAIRPEGTAHTSQEQSK